MGDRLREAPMSDFSAAESRRRRRFLPQFSLAAMFVLMTLAGIGAWYWYQRPFAVETESSFLVAADPFAAPASPPPSRSPFAPSAVPPPSADPFAAGSDPFAAPRLAAAPAPVPPNVVSVSHR